MKRAVLMRCILAGVAAALVMVPDAVLACSVCFGKSDSAMARGMNMGIFSLLGTITTVLLGVAGFFIFLARRSMKVNAAAGQGELEETVTRS